MSPRGATAGSMGAEDRYCRSARGGAGHLPQPGQLAVRARIGGLEGAPVRLAVQGWRRGLGRVVARGWLMVDEMAERLLAVLGVKAGEEEKSVPDVVHWLAEHIVVSMLVDD